ncbi:MAG TPA: glycosyl hydrolase family 28-related protein [Acidimicrobiia bacterium]|nr:glycosyl hydrolase family 28-related protein [Acidimicrobiia bacterium]
MRTRRHHTSSSSEAVPAADGSTIDRRTVLKFGGASAAGLAAVAATEALGARPAGATVDVHPGSYVVAANNALAVWKNLADAQCTGTNDHTTIQSAITAATNSGANGSVVELSEGDFYLGGSISIPSNVILVGQGANATILHFQPTTGSAIQIIGSGTSSHVQYSGLRALQLLGSASQSTSPIGIDIQYADNLTLEELRVYSFYGYGIRGIEWQDTEIRHCRFDWCGSPNGSGQAAVDINISSTSDSDSLRFTDCTWETCRDRDVRIAGNGSANRSNKVRFRGCKFEQSTRVRGTERVLVTGAGDLINFEGCDFVVGGGFDTGWSTKLDSLLHIVQSTAVNVRDCLFTSQGAGGAQLLTSFLHFDGSSPNIGVLVDGCWWNVGSTTNYPATAALVWSGTNNNAHNGAHAFVWDAHGSTVEQSGSPTSTV